MRPVQRSSVRASCRARPSATSTSSYSSRPSWATVSPPACTNRRDGKVGRPTSFGPPSAVRPRSTVPKTLSATEVVAGSGSGNQARSRWSVARVVELVADPEQVLAGPELEEGAHLDGPCAHAGVGLDPLGPRVGRGDRDPAPQRARPRAPRPSPSRAGRRPRRWPAGCSCRCRRCRRRRPGGRSPACPPSDQVPSVASTTTSTRPLVSPVAPTGGDRVDVERLGAGSGPSRSRARRRPGPAPGGGAG